MTDYEEDICLADAVLKLTTIVFAVLAIASAGFSIVSPAFGFGVVWLGSVAYITHSIRGGVTTCNEVNSL